MKDNMFKGLLLDNMDGENQEELIQLINPEEEQEEIVYPDQLPILPLKNTVLFPGVIIPITVGRKKSIRLVKKAYRGNRLIGAVSQKNDKIEDPSSKDIFKIGTVAKIVKMLVLPDGNTTIIIQGKKRFKIEKILEEDPYINAEISTIDENFKNLRKKENKALIASLKEAAFKILQLNPEIPQEAQTALDNIESPAFLTHFLSSNLNAEVADKQKLLEINNGFERITHLLELMMKEIQMLEIKSEIQKKVSTDIDQQQRDYFLRQQIKVLQDELGSEGPGKELNNFKERANKKEWPKEVAEIFHKEVAKIERMNPAAAEYPVAINYVELLLELPWNESSDDNFDLKKAKNILDRDHSGLEKVKDRIIEYLAVLKLKQDLKGPILCLYGPPGVGKTSLGRSISEALGRKYVKMSLGGLHDESEIRGHRKTYIGAMPGRIIRNMNKAGTSNPVFILDEIDKVSSDFRGDPASALLEVLDPEQNHSFQDNYLDIDYDLSKVLFVATANSLDSIHPALLDRMEIIEITGYTMEEKVNIAKKHLIPKQRENHGLKAKDIKISEGALKEVIEGYTRESGVRNLEREVGKLCRKTAKSVALEEKYTKNIGIEGVEKLLGPKIFDREEYQGNDLAGVVTGLAWTRVGGDILFIESSIHKGTGKLTISGQLGDVMKESAMAALSSLKSRAEKLGIDEKVFKNYDLHIHVPAGAVPKDGPSAGITLFTSLASTFTQRKIKSRLAMTGEITLRGKVLPVGGIKEKLLAARRAGIKEIILSTANKRSLKEINEDHLSGLKINFVETVDEVLDIALTKQKVKNPLKFDLQKNK